MLSTLMHSMLRFLRHSGLHTPVRAGLLGLWVLLLPEAEASGSSAAQSTVHVAGERLLLGELIEALPEPWAGIDVGPSPLPLQSRIFARSQLEARIRQAQLGPAPVPLPQRLQVTRLGQRLAEPQLRTLMQGGLMQALPADVTLRSLTLSGGLVLPEGSVRCEFPDLQRVHTGRQTVLATLSTQGDSGEITAVRVPLLLDLEVPPRAVHLVVQRGQTVTLLLRSGAVTVQTAGVVQAAGAVGDHVSVLPSNGVRVLDATVRDARTVEVTP
jgi:hypothetical protein